MALKTLLAYVAAVFVLFVIPGPAVLIVTSRSLQSGRRAGIFTGVGIGLADLGHALFTVLGLSALLLASATLFTLIKYAGVAYLVWLGLQALFSRPAPDGGAAPVAEPAAATPISAGEAFRQGFLSEILNPKTALFFLSFLPQFVDPAAGFSVSGQLVLLGAIFVFMSLLYTSTLALLADFLAQHWQTRGGRARPAGPWGQRLVGAVFLLVALRVALQGD